MSELTLVKGSCPLDCQDSRHHLQPHITGILERLNPAIPSGLRPLKRCRYVLRANVRVIAQI